MFQKFLTSFRDLKNILLCSIIRFTGSPDYPYSILPKKFFKKTIDIPDLIGKQKVILIRRSNKILEDSFNLLGETITLKEDCFSYHEIPELSMNLLGGKFKEDHLRFRVLPKSPGCGIWDGKLRVILSKYKESYEVIPVPCEIFLDGNAIHDQEVPYSRQHTKELEKLSKSLPEIIMVENGIYKMRGKIGIEAVPINLNYWHVETRIFDVEGHRLRYTGATYIKDICQQALTDNICYHSKPSIDEIPKVSFKYYWKNPLITLWG